MGFYGFCGMIKCGRFNDIWIQRPLCQKRNIHIQRIDFSLTNSNELFSNNFSFFFEKNNRFLTEHNKSTLEISTSLSKVSVTACPLTAKSLSPFGVNILIILIFSLLEKTWTSLLTFIFPEVIVPLYPLKSELDLLTNWTGNEKISSSIGSCRLIS